MAFDLESFLASLTSHPGVYRMLAADDEIIYVGKARNLRNRVRSYFRGQHGPKTTALVRRIANIEVTVTHTEAEALLLEHNLIKAHRPRYNVDLRDDKSYPSVSLSMSAKYPRIAFHRGAQREGSKYFGPYPSAQSVRASITELQRLFQLRPCTDSYFRNRSRPCLQHQIQRCTAPCVGLISEADYAEDVQQATLFLQGQSNVVVNGLVERMQEASQNLAFEQAAALRDRIERIRQVQQKQYVDGDGVTNSDVIALAFSGGTAAVTVMSVRQGRALGQKTRFVPLRAELDEAEFASQLIAHQYLEQESPDEVIINIVPAGRVALQAAIKATAGKAIAIKTSVRGERQRWLRMTESSLQQALTAREASDADMLRRREALQEAFALAAPPERMECFDISHSLGEATVASCVVFDADGPRKSDYRRFNIKDITAGDDYAAIEQAVRRRYQRLQAGEAALPDVLFIDGGKGQLGRARSVLDELGVVGVLLVGVAKGPERRAGLEQLFVDDSSTPLRLPPHSAALHLVQQIRDEAHRFAITGHRQRRAKTRKQSALEEIAGLGPKRRQLLLQQFGGLQGISRAGVEDLAALPGISQTLAQRIYDQFRG